MQRNNKKPALITGSTSGIGLSIAHSLARSGHPIMLHGLVDRAEGERLQREFSETYAIDSGFSNADIASESGCQELAADTREALGNPGVLVNNAGIQHTAASHEFPSDAWQKIISVNLSAAFYLAREVLPDMRAAGWGRVVNISSVHGLVASAEKAAYCAAKHGLIGLTKVMALENADCGVTANAVCPGWVETPLIQPQIEAIAREEGIDLDRARAQLVGAKQPMPRTTRPEAIGELVVYLCGEFAETITGASLPVDGGWTAQ
ncbi:MULTISPECIES: 3-hydroxybutyrate dehydrogenase [Microbulbifer]|uniref:3-hydroxybutyrate dehydrogenase n=1 Tax=Microbulbifer TaxID=48073 RepID=UPI001E589424|nr:3-hydroxybutyrate dehydrogenase [Microbulbifer sp. YPW16]UHQ53669.1 3-hydroxybutyrate dehydrogenase [Microbulbifer sp. YPW16]